MLLERMLGKTKPWEDDYLKLHQAVTLVLIVWKYRLIQSFRLRKLEIISTKASEKWKTLPSYSISKIVFVELVYRLMYFEEKKLFRQVCGNVPRAAFCQRRNRVQIKRFCQSHLSYTKFSLGNSKKDLKTRSQMSNRVALFSDTVILSFNSGFE